MNELNDYNIPGTMQDCWEKYPNYNWVYNSTRLLDAQHMPWSPFETSSYSHKLKTFTLSNDNGFIYIPDNENFSEEPLLTETIIKTGDLKWLAHYVDSKFIDEINGEADLRINAFIALYLRKFTGGVSFRTRSNHIYEISLCPTKDIIDSYPEVATKLLKKIYKKKL